MVHSVVFNWDHRGAIPWPITFPLSRDCSSPGPKVHTDPPWSEVWTHVRHFHGPPSKAQTSPGRKVSRGLKEAPQWFWNHQSPWANFYPYNSVSPIKAIFHLSTGLLEFSTGAPHLGFHLSICTDRPHNSKGFPPPRGTVPLGNRRQNTAGASFYIRGEGTPL